MLYNNLIKIIFDYSEGDLENKLLKLYNKPNHKINKNIINNKIKIIKLIKLKNKLNK
tara:strand:+ start:330 stop:500 length:171 start_codon:yes stop_codon:yes gene_type:complete